MSLLLVAGQTLAIYVFLVVILSRIGRALMAGLTHFDYLIVALLGSAVETGMYRGSGKLSAGLVSATTLILADHLTSFLMNRWPRLRRLLAGSLNVSFADMVNLAEGFGFRLARVQGSHHIFRHPNVPHLLNLQERDGQAKPYQIRQFLQFVERYDLRLEDEP